MKQKLMNDIVALINYKPVEGVTSQCEFELKMLEAQKLQLKLLLEIGKAVGVSNKKPHLLIQNLEAGDLVSVFSEDHTLLHQERAKGKEMYLPAEAGIKVTVTVEEAEIVDFRQTGVTISDSGTTLFVIRNKPL